MGELILCSRELAAFPYYIEQGSLNIYSLEELSYYIEKNRYLLDVDFMDEELCAWMDRALSLHETAARLREIMQKDGALSEFVGCILEQSGYCEKETIRQIQHTLNELAHKSEYECRKIRADRYLENGRYSSAIGEYRRLLRDDEENTVLVGNVWHNLGTAYAGLFFFKEAAVCFGRAYQKNENPRSLRECLYAYKLMGDEAQVREKAGEQGMTPEAFAGIWRDFQEICEAEEIRAFGERLGELFCAEAEAEICGIVEDWKETYRKNCKL